MPEKNIATNLSTSTNKRMRPNNSTFSDDHIALNFNKRPDTDIVTYPTLVDVAG